MGQGYFFDMIKSNLKVFITFLNRRIIVETKSEIK